MFERVLKTPRKLDIRQIKLLLKALLDWSFVNKYFSTVGLDRFRYNRSEVSCQKFVLKFFLFLQNSSENTCAGVLLVNKQVFSLEETQAQKFSCRFLQILKEHVYLKNHSGWLLLEIQYRLIATKIRIVFGS